MKQDNLIRAAIDERLASVHFDARDRYAVLHAVRDEEEYFTRAAAKRPRFQFALAMAMTLLLFIPISLLTLRLSGVSISTAPGYDALLPASTAYPQAIAADDADEINTSIAIARACYESVCDTSVFTFDEYDVKVTCLQRDSHAREYTVTMTSIYDNGCAFSVTVAMPQGEVTHYTTPSLATVPTYLDSSLQKPANGFSYSKLATWYTQYGPHLIAWPQDVQAEFSRRYEGAILRTAKEGELTAEQAKALAADLVRRHLPVQESIALYSYPQLYAERSQKGGVARYVVSVYTSAITDEALPEALGTVSFRTDGSDVVVTLH